eukprot:scaffold25122_cov51-Attheya_sp.AAC.1
MSETHKRSSPLFRERHPIAKKQRTTRIPGIRNKTDGSTACDNNSAGSERVMCQPSYDPHLLHKHKTRTRTSNQITSQVATADHAEIPSFNSRIETNLDGISNQDSESPPLLNDGFTELPCCEEESESEYEDMAQNSARHGQAAIPLVLNKKQKKRCWDKSFKDMVDFKKINGHTNVPTQFKPLGSWVSNQRRNYRLLKEGKDSLLTIDKQKKLERIGFAFKSRSTYSHKVPWDERFQELVDFKKINGHMNVPQQCGPLGGWVIRQRSQYRFLDKGKPSQLNSDQRKKLESIGFEFKYLHACSSWDQRFQEVVDFKKVNGHANVSTNSGPLGTWISNQRRHYRLLKEGKDSPLTIDRLEKLESIGFTFIIQYHLK